MSDSTNLERRKFLVGVGAGGVGAAAAVIGARSMPQGAAQSAGEATGQRKGYQLTEHVRNYYRTTRV